MKKSIYKRRREFLEEGVAFYSEDVSRRATERRSCFYRAENGNKCFIGRWIPDDKYDKDMEGKVITNWLVSILPTHISELGLEFLSMCQALHDGCDNWGNNGLTGDGVDYRDTILNGCCTPTEQELTKALYEAHKGIAFIEIGYNPDSDVAWGRNERGDQYQVNMGEEGK